MFQGSACGNDWPTTAMTKLHFDLFPELLLEESSILPTYSVSVQLTNCGDHPSWSYLVDNDQQKYKSLCLQACDLQLPCSIS